MYLHMNNRLFSRNDLVRLIIPLIVDQFLQVAVGLSDSIMVARVGEAAVSGVSLVDTVMLLIINIFTARRRGDRRSVSWKKRSEDRLRGDRPAF